MFESRKDLTERVLHLEGELKASEESITELQSSNDELRNQVAQLTQDLESEKSSISDSAKELGEVSAALGSANESLAEAQAKLDSFDEEVDAAAKAKAAAHLEKLGHPILEMEPSADDQDSGIVDHNEVFGSIEDPKEAFAYFQKHREAIRASRFKTN